MRASLFVMSVFILDFKDRLEDLRRERLAGENFGDTTGSTIAGTHWGAERYREEEPILL